MYGAESAPHFLFSFNPSAQLAISAPDHVAGAEQRADRRRILTTLCIPAGIASMIVLASMPHSFSPPASSLLLALACAQIVPRR